MAWQSYMSSVTFRNPHGASASHPVDAGGGEREDSLLVRLGGRATGHDVGVEEKEQGRGRGRTHFLLASVI